MTLKKFLKDIYRSGHYRVFAPNRDCLVYESFFKEHSSLSFNKHKKDDGINHKYFKDNPYQDRNDNDRITKKFIKEFGDFEVSSIELCSFYPVNILTNKKKEKFDASKVNTAEERFYTVKDREKDDLVITKVEDVPTECLNIFISFVKVK